MAAAGIVAGLRAVFKRDPFESLQRKALKALEPTIPGGEQRNALWRSLGEVFRGRELVSRQDWCAALAKKDVTEAFAAELYDRMEQEFSALVARAAGRNPTVFIQSAHKKLEELQAGQQDILAFVSQIQTVVGQGAATAARLDAIVTALEELKKVARAMSVSAPSTAPALHQLPPPPADFTGRVQELRELSDALHQGGVTISGVAGVAGMGGVGKTVLALKLAQQLADHYPDAQFYLNLEGTTSKPLTTADAMAHVIRGFYPEARMPDSEAELSGLYHTCLHGKRALLLMDNAAGAGQVEPLIPPAGCALIVTSRPHITLPGLRAKNLDVMPPPDARELLLQIATAPRIGDHADEIAKLCGYLPLALRLAAGALAEHPDLSPQDYARKLTDARHRLELVDASLGLSYDLLSEERRKLWRALAVFPGEFDSPAAAAVWAAKPDAAKDALSALVASSMVEWNETSHRYRLHDLARDCADSRMSDDERAAAQRRHAVHYENVLRAATESYKQGAEGVMRGLTLFDVEWINIRAGQEWAAAPAAQDDEATKLCSTYPNVGAYVLSLRQHPRESIAWFEAALAAARRLEDRQAEGGHLGNLGNAYAALGETRRAIEYYEQALVIDREIGDRRGEGAALGNLGLAYFALGETRRAIEYHEQALVISREIGDKRAEGQDLGNLGNAYLVLGEPRRAIEYYEQALVIAREIGDRRGEGNALGNLGNAYLVLGEPRRAIEFYEQCLEIAREIGNKSAEGPDLGNLGSAYLQLGEPRRAIEYHEQALVISREIGDKPAEGQALGNLGNAYLVLGETRRAIEYYEQRLAIAREIGDRRGEGNALWNMALALDKLGKRDQAIANAGAALEIYEQIEDPNAAKVRAQLAQWRRDTAEGGCAT